MTLVRQRTLPSVLDQFINQDFSPSFGAGVRYFEPAVNIRETADDFRIQLSVPGYEKSDLNLNLDQDVLEISAHVEEEQNEGYFKREFVKRSFTKRFSLPDSVNSDKISAKYNNGVLELLVPKKEEAKPVPARKIEIK